MDPIRGPYDSDLVLKLLDARVGDTVADIGCGYGGHARRLRAQLGPRGRVLGRDVDELTLEKARRAGLPDGCEFALSGRADVRIAPGTLDRAYMNQVWGTVEHQETRGELTRSLFQALKPGGELLVVQVPKLSAYDQGESFMPTLEDATRAAGFECGRRWQIWDRERGDGPAWVFEFRRPFAVAE